MASGLAEPGPPVTDGGAGFGWGWARRARAGAPLLGVVPFLAFVGIFLAIPTLVVAIGAFGDATGRPTLGNVEALGTSTIVDAFVRSIVLSASTALIGASAGAMIAYTVVTARPHGLLRRVVAAASGVLAQFGGVTLAFAFLATLGFNGFVTVFAQHTLGIDITGSGWLYQLPGLMLVYTYFQVPLMVIVFLPALDGIRPQWREAAEGLGGSTWQYWRHVGIPLLTPSFLGSTLLLFANAFSAYATAAALVSQGSPIVPLKIREAITSEVVLGQANVGKALALGMVLVVGVVMIAYARLQRRTARWLG